MTIYDVERGTREEAKEIWHKTGKTKGVIIFKIEYCNKINVSFHASAHMDETIKVMERLIEAINEDSQYDEELISDAEEEARNRVGYVDDF